MGWTLRLLLACPTFRALLLPVAVLASAVGFVVWLATWPEEFRIRVAAWFGLRGPYRGWPEKRYWEIDSTFGRRDWHHRPFHNLKSVTEALIDYDPQGWSKLGAFATIVAIAVVAVL